jgi:hypothetical protein
MTIFFAAANIVEAVEEITAIASTLGYGRDTVKQVVETVVKSAQNQETPACIGSYNCKSGYHDRKCPQDPYPLKN